MKTDEENAIAAANDYAHRVAKRRAGWREGPWSTEPDRVSWKTRAGFPALIVRNTMGNLCGYVAVPPGHPAHGVDGESGALDDFPEPHGGFTFSVSCRGAILHVPEPGEPDDVWWLGFDCAHLGDHWQLDEAPDLDRVYRDIPYVTNECEELAARLREMGYEEIL